MSTAVASSSISIALVGNPNTGKSTLFSALAGMRQRVGNYPGVTVEKKVGRIELGTRRCELIDLPGTYSLAPRSPDEMVAVDVLLGRRSEMKPVDAVLSIVDASNLERNLYLVSQVLELGVPTVIALNMVDVARKNGIEIDVAQLSARLGVPVVPVQANRRLGLVELTAAIEGALDHKRPRSLSPFPHEFQEEVTGLQAALASASDSPAALPLPRYLVERLLLDSGGYVEHQLLNGAAGEISPVLHASRTRLAAAGMPVPAVEAIARYSWVSKTLDGVMQQPSERRPTTSDRIDRALTHKLWGTLIFALVMLLVFSAVFIAAAPLMSRIDTGIASIGQLLTNQIQEGPLRSLLVDGVIGGVGSVLIFLPQILILFFFIAVLEDCGYMARAAYLMDKLMVRVGLSGKSFIPLLSSFACAVPGIMATRVIENRRDRLTTILVAPLMSCSARLPVYMILIGAFIPARGYLGGLLQLQGLVLFSMYLVGIVTAAVVSLVLKRTILRGPTPPFVMELPSYKWPAVSTVIYRMLDRAWSFLYRAGTLILAVAIVIWAASYYPHNRDQVEGPLQPQREALEARLASGSTTERDTAKQQLAELDSRIAAEYQRQSYLGRLGQAIEPVVRPLGWDWRIGCAVLASFPAREVVMGALGVIYNLGDSLDVGESSDQQRLEERLRSATWDGTSRRVFNVPVALSIMVFFALCAQCASTLAVIRRETNSWTWPLFTFTYMTVLAYVGALITYQVGSWLPAI